MSDDDCREASGGYFSWDYDDGECKWLMADETYYDIEDDMMCAKGAGRDAKRKDACKGDSGGALTVKEHGKHSLAGVVSWAYGCASVCFDVTYPYQTPFKFSGHFSPS